MTSPAAPTCQSCGAPDLGDLVICKFCQQAVSAEAQKSAIVCPNPQCRTLCRWGKQHCPQCKSWIVVSCVFCGALSPHSVSNCLQCNEAFAGAPQRKAAIEQQRQHQQNMQNMNAFGNIASGLLGGVAGGVAGGVIGSMLTDNGSSSSSDWSDDSSSGDSSFSEGFTGESGVSDNASFDWSGGDSGGGGSSDDY